MREDLKKVQETSLRKNISDSNTNVVCYVGYDEVINLEMG